VVLSSLDPSSPNTPSVYVHFVIDTGSLWAFVSNRCFIAPYYVIAVLFHVVGEISMVEGITGFCVDKL